MTSAPVAVRLLLVEDSLAQGRFILQTLQDPAAAQSFEVAWVKTLGEAMAHMERTSPDLVLLDLVLPDSDGLGTFESLHSAHPHTPVIILSGSGDETSALRAVAGGAQDYLPKGTLSPELLTRSVRYALERDRYLVELRRLALRDDLTGLLNRRGFVLLADQQLAVARRAVAPITVLFVDVDGLKRVNDTYGHSAGDRTLVDVAGLMKSTFRGSDVIGRVGGDEFCVLLVDDGASTQALPAASRFQDAIALHNAGGTGIAALSCTVGAVTRLPSDQLTVDQLLSQADQHLYDTRRLERGPRVSRTEEQRHGTQVPIGHSGSERP